MLHVPLIHFIQFKSEKITGDREKKGDGEEKKITPNCHRSLKRKYTCSCEYLAKRIVAETMS